MNHTKFLPQNIAPALLWCALSLEYWMEEELNLYDATSSSVTAPSWTYNLGPLCDRLIDRSIDYDIGHREAHAWADEFLRGAEPLMREVASCPEPANGKVAFLALAFRNVINTFIEVCAPRDRSMVTELSSDIDKYLAEVWNIDFDIKDTPEELRKVHRPAAAKFGQEWSALVLKVTQNVAEAPVGVHHGSATSTAPAQLNENEVSL